METKIDQNRITERDREMLEVGSGIAREIHERAGCFTAITEDDLVAAGFPRGQVIAPALVFPVHDWSGNIHHHVARPWIPRHDEDGDPVKYEHPKGLSELCIDIHPAVLPQINDPRIPLYITEGQRKSMSAISRGLCAVSVQGVWGWMADHKPLKDWDHIRLDRRIIRIAFDSDYRTNGKVATAMKALQSFLVSRGAIIEWVDLPPGPGMEKVGLDDWFAAGHGVGEIEDLVRRCPPTIETDNRELRDMSADAIDALIRSNNPPVTFVRSGRLTRLRLDEGWRPIIEIMREPELKGVLARSASFVRTSVRKSKVVPPPDVVVRDILALGDWPFPALDSVIESPALRPDGSLIDTPGYDPVTRLIYAPAPNLSIRKIPGSPMAEDVRAALELVDEVIGDFPYVDDASYANALGLMLTPILRPAIDGLAPLALIDKPMPGTGASLLSSMVSLVATGREGAMMAAPREEDEWRKRLFAALLAGVTCITIDNVDLPLASAALSMMLTARDPSERLLGRSEIASAPNRATWMATGNNIRLRGDIARRCYWIRMDAKLAHPWRRTEFRHPALREWVTEHRGEIVTALMVLARSWFAAGKAAADVPTIGSFEPWAKTIGGVLAHVGVGGFLGNLGSLYELVDEVGPQWEAFLSNWHRVFGDSPISVTTLLEWLPKDQGLADSLPDEMADDGKGLRSHRIRVGKALSRRADTIYGDLKLAKGCDPHTKSINWGVVPSAGNRVVAGSVSVLSRGE